MTVQEIVNEFAEAGTAWPEAIVAGLAATLPTLGTEKTVRLP